MTSNTNPPADREALLDSSPRGRKRTPKWPLVLVGVVVGLIIIVGVGVPLAIGTLAPGIVEDAVSDSIQGSVEIESIDAGWFGPQTARIRLLDPSGNIVFEGDASVDRPLHALALVGLTTSGDLGTVALSGQLTAKALPADTRTDAPASTLLRAIAPTDQTPPDPSADPFPLDNLSARIVLSALRATFTDIDGNSTIINTSADSHINFDGPGDTVIIALGLASDDTPELLTLEANVSSLFSADHALSPGTSSGTLLARADMPARTIRIITDALGSPVSVNEAVFVDADLRINDGSLTLDEANTVTVRLPLPLDDAGTVSADAPIDLTITRLDVPLNIESDRWPGARFAAALRTPAITGRSEGAVESFAFEQSEFTISAQPLGEGLAIKGRMPGRIDGRPIGDTVVSIAAKDLTADEGSLVLATPRQLVASVNVPAVPTALLASIAQGAGVDYDLESWIGDQLAVELDATAEDGTDGLLTATLSAQAPGLTANIAAQRDGDRITLLEPGTISIQRLGRIAGDLTGRSDLSRDASATINLRTLSLRQSPTGLDLSDADVDVSAEINGLTTQTDQGIVGIRVANIDARIAGGSAPVASLSANVAGGRTSGTVEGNLEFADLWTPDSAAPMGVRIDASNALPRASLRLRDLPLAAAAVVSPDLAQQLTDTLGPTLEGTLDIDATTASLDLTAGPLAAQGSAMLDSGVLRVRDSSPLTIRIADPAPLAAASPEAGLTLSSSQPLTLTVRSLAVPLDKFALDTIDAAIELDLSSLTIQLDDASAAVVGLNITDGAHTASLRDGTLTLEGSLAGFPLGRDRRAIGNRSFSLASDLTVTGFASALNAAPDGEGTIEPGNIRVGGRLSLVDAPVGVLAAFAGDAASASALREALGETLALEVNAGELGQGPVRLTLSSSNLEADARASWSASTVSVSETDASIRLTPALVDAIVAQALPDTPAAERPALDAPVRINANIQPTTLSYAGAPSEPLEVSINAESPVMLSRLMESFASSEDDPRYVNLALGGLAATLSLAPQPDNSMRTTGRINTRVLSPNQGRPVTDLAASFAWPLGDQASSISATNGDTARLVEVLGLDAGAIEALGNSFELNADVTPAGEDLRASFDIDSPRLTASGELVQGPSAVRMTRPIDLDWTLTPAAADALFFKNAGGPGFSLAEQIRITGNVRALTLGPADRRLDPSTARLDASINTTNITLVDDAGSSTPVGPVTAELALDESRNGISIVANAQAPGAAEPTLETRRLAIIDLYDPSGVVTADRARIDGTLSGRIPTALADALAGSGSFLGNALGEELVADITIERFRPGLAGGSATVDAAFPTGYVNVRAQSRDGMLVLTQGTKAELYELRPELVSSFIKPAFPILFDSLDRTSSGRLFADGRAPLSLDGALQKRRDLDAPSSISVDSLEIPVPWDPAGLNGQIRYDLGEVSFELPSLNLLGPFGKSFKLFNLDPIVEALGGNTEGQLGVKLEPFTASINDGIITTGETELPLGDYPITMKGRVNLVTGEIKHELGVSPGIMSGPAQSAIGNIPGLSGLLRVPIVVESNLKNPNDRSVKLGTLSGPGSGGGSEPERVIKGILDGVLRGLEQSQDRDRNNRDDSNSGKP